MTSRATRRSRHTLVSMLIGLWLALSADGCASEPFVPCGPEPTTEATATPITLPSPITLRAVDDPRVTLVFVPEGFIEATLAEAEQRARALLTAALASDAGLIGRVADHVAAYLLPLPSRTPTLRDAARDDTALGGCLRRDDEDNDGRLMIALRRVTDLVHAAFPARHIDATIVLMDTVGRPNTHGSTILLGRRAGSASFVHELGHALIGLGDEYAEGDRCWDGPTPAFTTWPDPFDAANLTRDPNGTKWHALVRGAEPGGDGAARCIYHPPGPCRMKDRREQRLCPVCAHAVSQWVQAVVDNDGPPACDLALSVDPEGLVAGDMISVDLLAHDGDGVAAVRLSLDGDLLYEASRDAPERERTLYTDTRVRLGRGPHVLEVTCVDSDGIVATRVLSLRAR